MTNPRSFCPSNKNIHFSLHHQCNLVRTLLRRHQQNLFLTLLRLFKQFPHRHQHNFVPTLLCRHQHNLFLTCLHPSNKDIQLPNFPHQQTQNMQSLHHHQNNLHAGLFLLHNGHRSELSPPANIHHKSSPTHSYEKPNYYNEYSK